MNRLKTRKVALAATALTSAGALCLVGCSSSAESAPVSAPSGMPGGGQGRFPGANGEIAAISGNTLQVQNDREQTAVTYSSATTITATTSATLAKVAVGDCVSANGEESGGALTAQMVRLSAPINGECASNTPEGGMGPGQPGGGQAPPDGQGYGQPPGDGTMTPPDGAPSGMPQGGGFTFANGKVVSKTANTIVISGQLITRNSDGPSSSSGNITINVAPDTTYIVESKATASGIKVGLCVRAMGDADNKGSITAKTLNLSEPTDGECQLGFGGRPGSSATGT